MTRQQLEDLLQRAAGLRIAVVGDFFVDQYWQIDPSLTEASLETGKNAHQVVAAWNSPGAAGTVASNLAALGVSVAAVGFCGVDGPGWQLRTGLRQRGISTDQLQSSQDRVTPTYVKPLYQQGEILVEGERFDCKNYRPTAIELEQTLKESVRTLWPEVDGFLLMDQVEEENCGVLTKSIRDYIAERAAADPTKQILADSRSRIGEFKEVMLKPNERELRQALGLVDTVEWRSSAEQIVVRNGRPLFVTRGDKGMVVIDTAGSCSVSAVPIPGKIDIVGAGDSTSAGIIVGMCLTGRTDLAAQLGTLMAAVTIRKIGTTGTASAVEVLQQWTELESLAVEGGQPEWVE